MIDALVHLLEVTSSTKDPQMVNWFETVHCGVCGRFTLRPYFFGCCDPGNSSPHTFCGECLQVHLTSQGPQCPSCHTKIILQPESLTFRGWAGAILGLLYVKMPSEAEKIKEEATDREKSDNDNLFSDFFSTVGRACVIH